MFIHYLALGDLAKAKLSTFWSAGVARQKRSMEWIKLVNNANVVSACDSLVEIAKLRSPPFERLGPHLRLPMPRPGASFVKMGFLLKGITLIHHQHAVDLQAQVNTLVADIFQHMTTTDYSLTEIGGDYNFSPDYSLTADGDPKVLDKIIEGMNRGFNDKNLSDITMTEQMPRSSPRPESFSDGIFPSQERGFNVKSRKRTFESIENPFVEFVENIVVQSVENPFVEARSHSTNGLPQADRSDNQQPSVVRGDPSIVEDARANGEMTGPKGQDTMNISSISLVSSRKRKAEKRDGSPVMKRRRLPLKNYLKSYEVLRGYFTDPDHLRKVLASKSWQEGMAKIHPKTVTELLNRPLLPILNWIHYTNFNLVVIPPEKEESLRGKQQSPVLPSPPTKANGSAPYNGPMDSPGEAPGSQNVPNRRWTPTLKDVMEVSETAFQGDASDNRGVKRSFEEEEEDPRKKPCLAADDTPKTVSLRGLPIGFTMTLKVLDLWRTKDHLITFHDLCPKGKVTKGDAAKAFSDLLELHRMRILDLLQEVPHSFSPLYICKSSVLIGFGEGIIPNFA